MIPFSLLRYSKELPYPMTYKITTFYPLLSLHSSKKSNFVDKIKYIRQKHICCVLAQKQKETNMLYILPI